MGTGGVYPPPPGYLEAVQRICREHEILLVADEVITGFGRVGSTFASERFAIDPDLIVIAKGITSGYLPLGGVIAAERVWGPFWEADRGLAFRHGITYSGHATACAAAAANLDIIDREGLVDRVRALESVLIERLRRLEQNPHVREVRGGVGLLAAVELHSPAVAEAVVADCLEAGVLIRLIAGSVLQISPPFVIDEEEIGSIAEAIGNALDAAGEPAEAQAAV